MGISGISSGLSAPQVSGAKPGTQLQRLEQELHRLETEKQRAVQAKDEEKVRKIEEKMRVVKEEIQRLKAEQETEQDLPEERTAAPSESNIDVYA